MNILFDKSLKADFIRAQKLEQDSSGYLVDSITNKRIRDRDDKLVKAKQFGGMRKGSRIYLTEDIDTVIKEATLEKKAA